MSDAAKKAASMAASDNPLFQQNVMNAFCVGLKETLEMMAQVLVTFEKPSIQSNWNQVGDVSAVIDFDTDAFRGSLYIHFPNPVLLNLYNKMVGESQSEMTSEIMDCIGEISNMAYGVAKGKLDPLQLKFSMSLPKVSKPLELKRISGVPHLRIPFYLFENLCQLEITIVKK